MPAHIRTQLRKYFAITLLEPTMASQTGSGTIYRSRVVARRQFPSIAVYTDTERYEVENPGYIVGTNPKIYRRWQRVVVEIAVQTNDNPDDLVDVFCVDIETLIADDDSMGGGAIATDLRETTIDHSGEGAVKTFTARLIYEVELRTPGNDPTLFLK